MGTKRRPSLSVLIRRITGLGPCTDARLLGACITALGHSVDADGFAILKAHKGGGAVHVLEGAGLMTPREAWPAGIKAPLLTGRTADLPAEGVLALTGPFPGDEFLGGAGVSELLATPLGADADMLITCALRRRKGTFPRPDTERFATVAGTVNLVVRCRQLEERLIASVNRDPLTGLALFSEFYAALTRELSRARRGAGSVTVGILSVAEQDPRTGTFQQPCDETVRLVAGSLADQLRNFDTLVRYSPREFAFVLPELRLAEGQRVMERVLGELVTVLGEGADRVTLHVGLSSYPEEGSTVERLIEKAEAAIGRAREKGQPGVSRWEE
ncbi:MAG: diguanylate cyclase [bacterium]|nr:MAG: diguanylate cyclase [bacterium]